MPEEEVAEDAVWRVEGVPWEGESEGAALTEYLIKVGVGGRPLPWTGLDLHAQPHI